MAGLGDSVLSEAENMLLVFSGKCSILQKALRPQSTGW